MTIEQDLPVLSDEHKKYALMGLARCGLTFSDCVHFFAQQSTDREKELRKLAHEALHEDGEVEIDDNAIVSTPEDAETAKEGAYVMAWVWVRWDCMDSSWGAPNDEEGIDAK